MPKNKTAYIGARFEKREKDIIESEAKKRDMNISDFVRQAIFSHIYFLNQFNEERKEDEFLLIKVK
jgi:hypothetical protein